MGCCFPTGYVFPTIDGLKYSPSLCSASSVIVLFVLLLFWNTKLFWYLRQRRWQLSCGFVIYSYLLCDWLGECSVDRINFFCGLYLNRLAQKNFVDKTAASNKMNIFSFSYYKNLKTHLSYLDSYIFFLQKEIHSLWLWRPTFASRLIILYYTSTWPKISKLVEIYIFIH